MDFQTPGLAGGNLHAAGLARGSRSGANLREAIFISAILTGADLEGVELSLAHLSMAHLGDANLQDAKLSRANPHEADLPGVEAGDANFTQADLLTRIGRPLELRGLKKKRQTTFWVRLCVELDTPLEFEEPSGDSHEETDAVEDDPGSIAVGFFQNFGVTASSGRAALDLALREAVQGPTAGQLSASDSEVTPIGIADLDPEIRQRSTSWRRSGIWYRSGRMFFGPEEEDGPN